MKHKEYILQLLGIIGVVVIERSLLGGLPGAFSRLHLIAVLIPFLVILRGAGYALPWAMAAGALSDMYSFLPFGVYITAFSASAAATYALTAGLLTNRSLYSLLVLAAASVISFEAVYMAMAYFKGFVLSSGSFAPMVEIFARRMKGSLVPDLLFAAVLFLFINMFSYRFKPFFIVPNK